uniref:TTF-type domain-containing protein n=1 Tax=Latimeria chalumnae TaxID=7897 RepID=H3AWY1_LATCH
MRRRKPGTQKRKKKKLQEEAAKRQQSATEKFIKRSETLEFMDDESVIETEAVNDGSPTTAETHHAADLSYEDEDLLSSNNPETVIQDVDQSSINLHDPGTWPSVIDSKLKSKIVDYGPYQVKDIKFPEDEKERHFTASYYLRKLPNGETISRNWLVYSQTKDAVYCFCCKLFPHSTSVSQLSTDGFRSWQDLSQTLKIHENSNSHMKNAMSWDDLGVRLKCGQTIDTKEQELYQERVRYWHGIIERLIAIIQHLAERKLVLRGSTEKLHSPNSGNFLGQVELMARFDPLMQQHLQAVENKDISDHYIGVHIQNELIQIIAEKILDEITSRIQSAKYYSIILDCITDRSHTEQMTVIVRFVRICDSVAFVEEHFIGFLDVHDSTGQGLTDLILSKLDEMKIKVSNMCGQCYDNGANMAGHVNGVQACIKSINPRAFYSPCQPHSLNLLLCDAAKPSTLAMKYFGTLQRIYALFSGSSKRWDLLKAASVSITVKPLSDTHWEAKIAAVKVPCYELKGLINALESARDQARKPTHYAETDSFIKDISSYQFILSTVIWYDTLFRVNSVSKMLQSNKIHLDITMNVLLNLNEFRKDYRENGFETVLSSMEEIYGELNLSCEFPLQRYEGRDEPVINPKDNFRINFFLKLVDTTITAANERFRLLNNHNKIFVFLYKISALQKKSTEKLLENCTDLQSALSHESSSDIDAYNLCSEL